MDKKNITKVGLAESLRTLMTRMPFSSITIKKICDEAGVVRVTFYNYFVDKYDALNELLECDLKDGIHPESQTAVKDLAEHLVHVMTHHRSFYEMAVDIDGQNGFQEIFIGQMKAALIQILNVHRADTEDLSNSFLAEAYAVLIFYALRTWLKKKNSTDKELVSCIVKMLRKSFCDLLHEA